MRFFVHHFSQYDYSVPISLGTHTLRLVPQGPALKLLSHDLLVVPEPASRATITDPNGNLVVLLTFSSPTTRFRIDSRFEALIVGQNPAHGLALAPLPWASQAVVEPAVQAFADGLAGAANFQVLSYLDRLTHTLFSTFDRSIRFEGAAQSAHETLERRGGACRDLAVLFIDCCRAQGLAARFVSGYQAAAETPDGQHHLHAWAEVFLPGHGWKGFDPTHGLSVSDGHVFLCAAPDQASAMPVEGGFTFIGETVSSTLTYGVNIRTSS